MPQAFKCVQQGQNCAFRSCFFCWDIVIIMLFFIAVIHFSYVPRKGSGRPSSAVQDPWSTRQQRWAQERSPDDVAEGEVPTMVSLRGERDQDIALECAARPAEFAWRCGSRAPVSSVPATSFRLPLPPLPLLLRSSKKKTTSSATHVKCGAYQIGGHSTCCDPGWSV